MVETAKVREIGTWIFILTFRTSDTHVHVLGIFFVVILLERNLSPDWPNFYVYLKTGLNMHSG